MAIRKDLIDELIATSGGSLIGPDGLVKELTKMLVERMLAGEMNHHLGYEKHDPDGYGSGNSRNGKSRKILKGESGEMTIKVPRDRNGTFEPKLIEKHQTRFEGFDAKILSMYALGMTTRDIQGHLHDMYGVDVSAALISEVTDGIQEEVKAWQDRPLEALYPIVYLDALMVKMRQDGKVDNRAVYTAIGINMEGQKSVLGLWVSGTEGAKFWMSVLQNLKNRGMKDAFVICTDGLKGFPEAIEAVFPSTLVQTCIVHLIRASLSFVNWKERKVMAADLKPIYRAVTAEMAALALAEFRAKYPKHQVVADVWSRNWQRVILQAKQTNRERKFACGSQEFAIPARKAKHETVRILFPCILGFRARKVTRSHNIAGINVHKKLLVVMLADAGQPDVTWQSQRFGAGDRSRLLLG